MEINLSIIGSGYIIKYFNTESEVWRKLGSFTEEKIRNSLYSDNFLNLKLKSKNGIEASTFFEVKPSMEFIAYNMDRMTRLEIKVKNKSRSKIFFKDIISEELLFPLYNYKIEKSFQFADKGLVILENDIGSFGKCKLNRQHFEIDKLTFDIINIETRVKHVILKIHYDEEELHFKKKETLFNGDAIVLKISTDKI